MKLILILLLTSAALRAQVPHIDYMMADEAKSQLQIHGTFGPDHTGSATIEGIPCSVRFWSDTMVICDLPDSGAGSGGHVIVQQMSGTSNARMLSIFRMTFFDRVWHFDPNPYIGGFMHMLDCDWIINWREDIAVKPPISIPFEISKSSHGEVHHTGNANGRDAILPWSDSIKLADSSISLKGTLDLQKYLIKFGTALMKTDYWSYDNTLVTYQPLVIPFDTFGSIANYVDTFTYLDPPLSTRKEVYLINSQILFPPGVKSSVPQSSQPYSNLIKIFSRIISEDHQISFEAEEALGETTASLYSIDGRLLKQGEISIPAAGMYSLDVGGVNARMGFLVMKTEKGMVAEKVVF
ncbi:MAG: hypothetical protein ACHQM6_08035 [Candidatus Kapaibacterium sp.]